MAMALMAPAPNLCRHIVGTAFRCTVSTGYDGAAVTDSASFQGRISPPHRPTARPRYQYQSARFSNSKSGESEAAAVTTPDNAREVQTRPPAETFPWRHEAAPPSRILENDDLSGMPNNVRARFVRRFVACRELGLGFWEGVRLPFFTHQWEADISANFMIAFRLALEELLRHAFRGAVAVQSDAAAGVSINSSVKTDTVIKHGYDQDTSLERMFDDKLVQKFRAVDFDRLRLKLKVRPTSATLQHIFAVPLITRDIVKKKPHLEGSYQAIEKAFSERKSYHEVKEMTYALANEIGEDDAYRRTVIADVLITCSELFQLRDDTGNLLRGMEDDATEEEIVHNVRFEVTTDKDEGGRGRRLGSWKIVDLDDLLEGNVFY